MGRKYPKHISIQVKQQHNDDLKFLASKLSNLSTLPEGKNWTIRDIILTLLYTQYNNSPEWFVNNHFEKLTSSQLERIRNAIHGTNDVIVDEKKSTSKPKQVYKPKISTQLKLKLNPSYETYLGKLNQIKQEDK
ncbi:MAG: hypothetical protein ACXAC2_10680 [Candidatus Kariarchaeaceae archaeon]